MRASIAAPRAPSAPRAATRLSPRANASPHARRHARHARLDRGLARRRLASSPRRSRSRRCPWSPSGSSSSASGATRSTPCAATSRCSPRASPMPSSPATRGPATSSLTPSAAAARPRSRPARRAGWGWASISIPWPPCSRRRRSMRRPGPMSAPAWASSTCASWTSGRPGRTWPTRPSPHPVAAGRRCPRRVEARSPAPLPPEVALAFHPRTLAELLFLRHELHALDGPAALADRRDRFIAGAVLGILHGRSATYLSDLMPNSFSMAPRYVREFVARTGFRAAERDTFGCIEAKLRRLYRQGVPPGPRRGPAGRRPKRRGPGAGGPAGPCPARPRPTGRDQPALHARRQVRLLQLAAAVVPGGRPGRRRRRAGRCPPPARLRRLPAPGPGRT